MYGQWTKTKKSQATTTNLEYMKSGGNNRGLVDEPYLPYPKEGLHV